MSRAKAFLGFVAVCLCLLAVFAVLSGSATRRRGPVRAELGAMTRALHLTDLSFSNDARYTRHPSQADLFSAFQDYPGSIEHFPSGSVAAPPDFSNYGTTLKVRRR